MQRHHCLDDVKNDMGLPRAWVTGTAKYQESETREERIRLPMTRLNGIFGPNVKCSHAVTLYAGIHRMTTLEIGDGGIGG